VSRVNFVIFLNVTCQIYIVPRVNGNAHDVSLLVSYNIIMIFNILLCYDLLYVKN